MFRLPANLVIEAQQQVVGLENVAAAEAAMAPFSRMLVALNLTELPDDLLTECERLENAILEAGIPAWPEYGRFVTPDADGEPVVWITYLSGGFVYGEEVQPAIFGWLLLLLAGGTLVPIIGDVIDIFKPAPANPIGDLLSGSMGPLLIIGGLGLLLLFMRK
jgi:hypothetical protein